MGYQLCENCSLYFEQGKTYCKLCGHPLTQAALSEPAKVCRRCHLLHGAVSARCAFCAGELRLLHEAPVEAPTARAVARGTGPAPAPSAASAVPRPAAAAAKPARPPLSGAWMDWKVLAALTVVPLLLLTAAFLALTPGGGLPGWPPVRPPASQAGGAAEEERLNAEGIAAARAGRLPEAEGAFLAALEAHPESVKARNNLGVLYRRLRRLDEAVVMYEQAIALDPTNPVPHKNLGLIYEEQGRRAKALRHFEQYRTLRPDAPDTDEISRKIARLRRP
ncbi:MAG: tetratricopeptide repeat protein [candidate division NC10 bacterium]|nr:tetratricopeptide repeat protein [candidate division NC10 bacterium]